MNKSIRETGFDRQPCEQLWREVCGETSRHCIYNEPLDRFSTIARNDLPSWQRNFSFPVILFSLAPSFETEWSRTERATSRHFGDRDNVATSFSLPFRKFACSLLCPPRVRVPWENERDRFRMMAFTSVCRMRTLGVISRILCRRDVRHKIDISPNRVYLAKKLMLCWN